MLLQKLQDLDLPAPVPVAASVIKNGLFLKADLITLEIPGATTVADLLLAAPISEGLWNSVGQCVKRFHNADIYHADLNARNILIDASEKVFLIDFDKGCERYLGDGWKASNLARLHRSLNKFKSLNIEFHFSEKDWKSLLEGYSGN